MGLIAICTAGVAVSCGEDSEDLGDKVWTKAPSSTSVEDERKTSGGSPPIEGPVSGNMEGSGLPAKGNPRGNWDDDLR